MFVLNNFEIRATNALTFQHEISNEKKKKNKKKKKKRNKE